MDDANTVAGWSTDPMFCRAADWTLGLGPSEHLAFQTRLIAAPPPDLVRLGAEFEGRLVGYVALQGAQVARRELGFVIGERARWGRGLGTAAASAGLRHGLSVMGLWQIWAEALDANAASIRVLERLGMRETGAGDPGAYPGEPSHYRRFVIDRSDFPDH